MEKAIASLFCVLVAAGCASSPGPATIGLNLGPVQKVEFACPADGLHTKQVSASGHVSTNSWHGADDSDPVDCRRGGSATTPSIREVYGFFTPSNGGAKARAAFASALAGSPGEHCFFGRGFNTSMSTSENQYRYCVEQLGTTTETFGGRDVPVTILMVSQSGADFAADYTLHYDAVDHLIIGRDVTNHRGSPVPGFRRTMA